MIKYINGNKTWCLNGQYHREDGPAIEWANGNKEWRLNGQLHRVDGPAIEKTNNHKEWWLNGKLHREDGPAVEYTNGDKEWYINGKRHREDGPAISEGEIEKYYLNDNLINEKIFLSNKEMFLTENPLPRKLSNGLIGFLYKNIIYSNSEMIYLPLCTNEGVRIIFYKNHYKNEYHREDGPAIINTLSGNKEWYLNGQRHRKDGPAIECTDGHKEWYLNDKLHREDGPAVEYTDGRKDWYLNGKLHREDGPAVDEADGRKEWWLNGQRHREDGPALIDPVFKIEEWYVKGKLHREGNPAHIKKSDEFIYYKWYYNNLLHREDGPAIENLMETKLLSKTIYKEYYINGLSFGNDDKIFSMFIKHGVIVKVDLTTNTEYLTFNNKKILSTDQLKDICIASIHTDNYDRAYIKFKKNDKLHREDGPAIINDKYIAYYLNNKFITKRQFRIFRSNLKK